MLGIVCVPAASPTGATGGMSLECEVSSSHMSDLAVPIGVCGMVFITGRGAGALLVVGTRLITLKVTMSCDIDRLSLITAFNRAGPFSQTKRINPVRVGLRHQPRPQTNQGKLDMVRRYAGQRMLAGMTRYCPHLL